MTESPHATGPLTPATTTRDVFGVEALGYLAEERFLYGTAPTFDPFHEGDFTVDAAPARVEPDQLGGPLGGPASGPPPLTPGMPTYHGSDLTQRVPTGSGSYVARVIIYRPVDAARFSGNVFVETIHPTGGGSTPMWASVNESLIARGDAYVGVTHPRSTEYLKWHYGSRYSEIRVDDFSLIWGMLADAATAARQGLLGFRAERAFLTGYSFTGLIATTFARNHHQLFSSITGSPVFDGYPIGTGFGPFLPMSVPVMFGGNQYAEYNDSDIERPGSIPSVATRSMRSDIDSGLPGSRHRRYEIVGFQHIPAPSPEPTGAIPPRDESATSEEWRAQWPAGASANPNRLGRAAYEAIFRNMIDWVVDGIAPPRSELITTSENAPVLGPDGNPAGGLRLPDIVVPSARFVTGTGKWANWGYQIRYSAERLRDLYESRSGYLAAYDAAVDAAVSDRLVLPARGVRMKADVRGEARRY